MEQQPVRFPDVIYTSIYADMVRHASLRHAHAGEVGGSRPELPAHPRPLRGYDVAPPFPPTPAPGAQPPSARTMLARMSSWNLNMTRTRVGVGVLRHLGKASAAARTAESNSALVVNGSLDSTS